MCQSPAIFPLQPNPQTLRQSNIPSERINPSTQLMGATATRKDLRLLRYVAFFVAFQHWFIPATVTTKMTRILRLLGRSTRPHLGWVPVSRQQSHPGHWLECVSWFHRPRHKSVLGQRPGIVQSSEHSEAPGGNVLGPLLTGPITLYTWAPRRHMDGRHLGEPGSQVPYRRR